MTKSYADACLERAEQTRGSDFISNWVLVEDINELARRLNNAIHILRRIHNMDAFFAFLEQDIKELEAMPEDGK